MNSFVNVLTLLNLAAVAGSVTLESCGAGSAMLHLDWGKCTKQPDGEYGMITLVSGSLANNTAVARYEMSSSSTCKDFTISMMVNCSCVGSLKLLCGSVTLESCASQVKGGMTLEWDTCTQMPDNSGRYQRVTYVNGTSAGCDMDASYNIYTDAECATTPVTSSANCSCGGNAAVKFACGSDCDPINAPEAATGRYNGRWKPAAATGCL
eukprot:TRINITY_DN1752_c0_g1_i2.p1 TRINITY_DN1752_c0_g1~~TRINITY_DN1752_c0_g1_i2.p1  ORF type:complete len:209 (+),score=40.36 TRINITY_DN1752_c0_g1_i2:53-679(+)